MKKTLAILLSLALVICMIPATAFAAPTEVTAGYDVSSISCPKRFKNVICRKKISADVRVDYLQQPHFYGQ